jgi:hypothetical protein
MVSRHGHMCTVTRARHPNDCAYSQQPHQSTHLSFSLSLSLSLARVVLQAKQSAYAAARAEILLPEEPGFLEPEGMERTYKFTQKELRKSVDVSAARKVRCMTQQAQLWPACTWPQTIGHKQGTACH